MSERPDPNCPACKAAFKRPDGSLNVPCLMCARRERKEKLAKRAKRAAEAKRWGYRI